MMLGLQYVNFKHDNSPDMTCVSNLLRFIADGLSRQRCSMLVADSFESRSLN